MTIRPDINMPERRHGTMSDLDTATSLGWNWALEEVARLNPAAGMDEIVASWVVQRCQSWDGWWRNGGHGRYYIGPSVAGDGSIDWPEPTPADLAAEVGRLTAERDAFRSKWSATVDEIERLTAERDEAAAAARAAGWKVNLNWGDAPPIPCVEVDATDGRRTWRAMGEDVRTLGDEWERLNTYKTQRQQTRYWVTYNRFAKPAITYLIRRTAPEPTTERVPWWEAMVNELPIAAWNGRQIKDAQYQTTNKGIFLSTHGQLPVIRVDAPDGTVEVLRESEDA